MNRRSFIRTLITIPIAAKLPNIGIPYHGKYYGIDWGYNDATIYTWMGINRSLVPQFSSHSWIYKSTGNATLELVNLIKILEADKNK